MATKPMQRRNPNRWRIIAVIFIAPGIKWMQRGMVIPGLITIIGGLTLFPLVNKHVIYVPVPVGGTLIGLGWLLASQ